MDICEAFLNTYRDLEEILATKYGQRAGLVQLYSAGEGSIYSEELTLFREMRNLLSHHGKINGENAVMPSQASLDKLTEILEYAKNPPVALSIATPAEHLLCARHSDDLIRLLGIMDKKGYSHIPLLGPGGVLSGVFSVGTVFAHAKNDPSKPIKGLQVKDLAPYLPPEKHTTEKFAFTGKDATLYELKQLFKFSGPYHRRIVAVFVTETGDMNEKLLGMITPWDVFKAEGK